MRIPTLNLFPATRLLSTKKNRIMIRRPSEALFLSPVLQPQVASPPSPTAPVTRAILRGSRSPIRPRPPWSPPLRLFARNKIFHDTRGTVKFAMKAISLLLRQTCNRINIFTPFSHDASNVIYSATSSRKLSNIKSTVDGFERIPPADLHYSSAANVRPINIHRPAGI